MLRSLSSRLSRSLSSLERSAWAEDAAKQEAALTAEAADFQARQAAMQQQCDLLRAHLAQQQQGNTELAAQNAQKQLALAQLCAAAEKLQVPPNLPSHEELLSEAIVSTGGG